MTSKLDQVKNLRDEDSGLPTGVKESTFESILTEINNPALKCEVLVCYLFISS
ncbi:MAG: hypothetical protein LBI29_02925 [Rickettsiales bacterium]|jgi:hypothetical protein|nr:hypothetical protein [Rickettsiales bacterium]